MFQKFDEPLNPLWEELDKHEQMRLHRAYEREKEGAGLMRLLTGAALLLALVCFGCLVWERTEHSTAIIKANQEVKNANARVLTMVDELKNK